MAFFPNDSLFDGYAELVSEGFFDWNNTPPHDTWVWMVRGTRVRQHEDGTTGEYERNYLVAWVPPDFIERADLGIVGNPEDCIMWLEKLDDDFARSLRRLKLVA